MLQLVSSAFQSFVDLFVVTAPSIKVEELPDTSDAGGCVTRLTEASGEYRDIYVRHRLTKDTANGGKLAVVDLASPATEYVVIKEIDHSDLSSRGRPKVHYGDDIDTPISEEDHEVLVDFFESKREKLKKAGLGLEIVRLYPAVPKEGSAENDTKNLPELKL